MLVLSRKIDESIVIDGTIRVTLLGIRGNQVRLGIEAPPDVRVVREELVGIPRYALDEHSTDFHQTPFPVVESAGLGGPLLPALNKYCRR